MSDRPAIHLNSAVWGDDFTDLFVRVVLPTWLSGGNLGGIEARQGDAVQLFGDTAALDAIRGSAAGRRLSAGWPVRYHDLTDALTSGEPAHAVLGGTHEASLRLAAADDASMWFMAPDAIFNDGAIRWGLERLADGFRAAVCVGIRTVRETVVPALAEAAPARDDGAVSTVSGDLAARLAVDHLHDISASLLWDAPLTNHWPSHLYRRVDRQGLAVRAFHQHPLVVWPERWDVLLEHDTVDGAFMSRAVRRRGRIAVSRGSQDALAIEMSAAAEQRGAVEVPPELRVSTLRRFVLGHTLPIHRDFARVPVRVCAGRADEERWAEVEGEIEHTVMQPLWRWLRITRVTAPVARPTLCVDGRVRPRVLVGPAWLAWRLRVARKRHRHVGTLRYFAVRTTLRKLRLLPRARP